MRLVLAAPILLAASCALSAEIPVRRIAMLSSDATCASNDGLRALIEALPALGYRPGENVHLDCRSAEGQYERLDSLAQALVRQNPAVLVAAAGPASLAAKRATATIPIISVYTADPVGLGLVKSLAHPGTNVTGISSLSSDYAAKTLQLLRDVAPNASRVGILGHRANATYAMYAREMEVAAKSLGVTLDFVGVDTTQQLEAGLASLKRHGAHAIVVMHQPFTFVNRAQIVELIAGLRLPAVYGSREAVAAGGLMSYAASVGDTFRRAAHLVDKVLRGAKPVEMPVEQPTKFELVLNLRTATALGVTIPPAVLVRADEVIQ